MRLFLILTGLVAVLSFACIAQSQQPQQGPRVDSKQQPDRPVKGESEGSDRAKGTSNALTPQVLEARGEPSTRERSDDAHKGGDEATEFWTILGRHLKITDTLVVVFTFLLFAATLALWRATDRLVRGADETAERQLRAYIFVESGKVETPLANGRFMANLIVRNSGKTPAYDVVCDIGMDAGREFLAEWDKDVDDDKPHPAGSGAIGPGSHIVLDPESTWLADSTILYKCFVGEYALFVYGLIRYRDAFGKARHTRFRMYRNRGNDELAMWKEGNEAT